MPGLIEAMLICWPGAVVKAEQIGEMDRPAHALDRPERRREIHSVGREIAGRADLVADPVDPALAAHVPTTSATTPSVTG